MLERRSSPLLSVAIALVFVGACGPDAPNGEESSLGPEDPSTHGVSPRPDAGDDTSLEAPGPGVEPLGPVLPGDRGEWKERPAPPAISGGTMVVLRDGVTVVAADPDRDVVWVVDLSLDPPSVASIPLEAGDEPGRLVEDDDGNVHVVLRRAGAVVSVDMAVLEVFERRTVCPEARGIAVDDAGLLHVACRGGDLVSLPAAGGAPLRRVNLGVDLRDVVIAEGNLYASRFRDAELVEVDSDGAVTAVHRPPMSQTRFMNRQDPTENMLDRRGAVAWRTRALDDGSLMMVHQQAIISPIPDGDGGYGGMDHCRAGQVATTVTWMNSEAGAPTSAIVPMSTLPVDFAVSPNRERAAIASAGSKSVLFISAIAHPNPDDLVTCHFPTDQYTEPQLAGEPVAVEFLDDERVVVQLREPAMLLVLTYGQREHIQRIALPGESRAHPGHILFHMSAAHIGSISCASCHPEGTDDGHVWHFQRIGQRRTMTLIGGLLDRAPFHWDADLETLDDLMGDVFAGRMGGGMPERSDLDALAIWMDALPVVALANQDADAEAVARGRALFENLEVGCATCHSGAGYTNNIIADVGTGGFLKTPTLLNISLRPPYMHNGCAETLEDRFGPCGGGDAHGKTSHLSAGQISDLIAYLETL